MHPLAATKSSKAILAAKEPGAALGTKRGLAQAGGANPGNNAGVWGLVVANSLRGFSHWRRLAEPWYKMRT